MMKPPNVLTIAGSDSGGGAGIQADLKTIAFLGGYGMSVITALTAQSGLGVDGVFAPEPEFVGKQLDSVLKGFTPDAAKTGMLYSTEIIEIIADKLKSVEFPIVVDPVSVSQTGHTLLQEEAVEALKTLILPLAEVVTPNKPEAEMLTGVEIRSKEDTYEVVKRLLDMGPRAVLLKGGHFDDGDEVADCLGRSGEPLVFFTDPRVVTENTHGTGCTLSAALATGLGKRLPLEKAAAEAKNYITLCLKHGYAPGQGFGPPNHAAPFIREQARTEIMSAMDRAGRKLTAMPGMYRLIPEVRLNLAYGLPLAEKPEDVAAFSGRITSDRKGNVIVAGKPEFGASSHIAKVVITASRCAPTDRPIAAAANIRWSKDILDAVMKAGLAAVSFDRTDEPKEVKEREGSTLEWGTKKALEEAKGTAVDAVWDKGESGKEPMIRILGRDSDDVLYKIGRILDAMEDED